MKISPREDIGNLTFPELAARLAEMGAPGYRAAQVCRWLYRRDAAGFEAMTDLPAPFRAALATRFGVGRPEAAGRWRSADGSEKILFRLADGAGVETVLIPETDRLTVCVSTQVGCRRACAFCASGASGFTRDLTPGEMTGQAAGAARLAGRPVTNLVFMGMGEPLDNRDNLVRALEILTDRRMFAFSPRRLTVSTCGLPAEIDKLAELPAPVNLALSLHAPEQELRCRLMPVSRRHPLPGVLRACARYARRTGRELTLEYALVAGVNDSPRQARQLAAIAGRLGAMVNLLEISPVPGKPFRSPGEKETAAFAACLRDKGVRFTRRRPRGADIGAACGQLAGARDGAA